MRGFACSLALLAGLVAPAHSAEWGTITGRIVYDGKAPKPRPLLADNDQNVCGQHVLLDESHLVDADGGLIDVLVFLRNKNVEVAPDYEKTANDGLLIECKDCRFEPHISILRTSQTLVIRNSDPVVHNTKGDPLKNAPFNHRIAVGDEIHETFGDAETLPFRISDNIHPWMSGWVLVRSTPYAAVTDDKGNFTIKDLPADQELEFQLWQETAGYLQHAKNNDVKVDKKGRFRLKLKPGENDLGEFVVSPAIFKK